MRVIGSCFRVSHPFVGPIVSTPDGLSGGVHSGALFRCLSAIAALGAILSASPSLSILIGHAGLDGSVIAQPRQSYRRCSSRREPPQPLGRQAAASAYGATPHRT